ncbi:MAG TPA: AprI/Inh family metalloprotease inhibitor [Rhizomicrobium sp.]
MTKVYSLLLGGTLALGLIGLAHADSAAPTGAWKLSTGVNDAPCVITLTNNVADAGPVASTGDCNGTVVGHWKTVGTTLQLSSPTGELVAWLKPKGDAYEGKRISDGRAVALAR